MEITSGGALTAGELIRSARSRAALSQHELAERLGVPRTQIGRWENGDVEPAFATVRRVLRACGFDLSTALVPYDPDAPHVARLVELSRLTPKERLDAALLRGGHRRLGYTFDPYTASSTKRASSTSSSAHSPASCRAPTRSPKTSTS